MTIHIANFFFLIFVEDSGLYTLVQFKSDWISPREGDKNGRIGAHGFNWKIFLNFQLIFEIYDENYSMKKIFVIFVILAIFLIFKWPFWRNGQKCLTIFLVIFGQVDVLYILVEFGMGFILTKVPKKNERVLSDCSRVKMQDFRQFRGHLRNLRQWLL